MQEDSKFKTSLYRLARSATSKEKGKDGGRGLGSILRLVFLPKGVCEVLGAISINEGGERSKWVQALLFSHLLKPNTDTLWTLQSTVIHCCMNMKKAQDYVGYIVIALGSSTQIKVLTSGYLTILMNVYKISGDL